MVIVAVPVETGVRMPALSTLTTVSSLLAQFKETSCPAGLNSTESFFWPEPKEISFVASTITIIFNS